MRFDQSKAWPHPVLRPLSYGDDYPHAEFEVEIEVSRGQGSVAVEVEADFQLSDPDLLRLVDEGSGQYVLLIKASKTHFRGLIRSDVPHMQEIFTAGDLSGRVEFAPFLVCTRALTGFRAEGWHPDFNGRRFHIAAGSVLAEDERKEYWVDTADEAPLGSIFAHKLGPDLSDGRWEYDLVEDRIWIVMSKDDSTRFPSGKRTGEQPTRGPIPYEWGLSACADCSVERGGSKRR